MHIQIISLLPQLFQALNYGIPHRAQQKGKLTIEVLPLRKFSTGKYSHIDDRPYGGGPGMVLKAEPLLAAISAALEKTPQTVISYLSPQGKKFDQKAAYQLTQRDHLIFVAGRYEGIDERVYSIHNYEEWSLGDFVLSGGELAVLCMIDAISRLIPGVLGNHESAEQDSFSLENNLLDHPHYTRPERIRNLDVPPVLLSGHHAEIKKWRLQQSLKQTWLKRPDLLKNRCLTPQEKAWIEQWEDEN
jgi:tRNA (guanine37-N1)-methyltransferase